MLRDARARGDAADHVANAGVLTAVARLVEGCATIRAVPRRDRTLGEARSRRRRRRPWRNRWRRRRTWWRRGSRHRRGAAALCRPRAAGPTARGRRVRPVAVAPMAHVATREVSRLKTAVVVRVVRSTADEVGDVLLVDAGRLGGLRGREVERRGRNRGRRAENELDEERGVHRSRFLSARHVSGSAARVPSAIVTRMKSSLE